MLEKTGIFRRDHRLSQCFWNLRERSQNTALDKELSDGLAIIRIDGSDQTRLIVLEQVERWKIVRKVPDDSCNRCPPHDGDGDQGDQDDLPPTRAAARLFLNFDEPCIAWHEFVLLKTSDLRGWKTLQCVGSKLK